MKKCAFYQTPIGRIGLAENGSAITDLIFENQEPPVDWDAEETPLLKKAARQLCRTVKPFEWVFVLVCPPFHTGGKLCRGGQWYLY